jgi:hypothetical protein
MSDKYIISHESGITKIIFNKKPSYDDLIEMVDLLVQNHPYKKRLYDLREIEFDVSTSEIEALAAYGKKVFTEANKAAIITNNDLAYGEMRQFMVYREQDDFAAINVFREIDKAIEWLNY